MLAIHSFCNCAEEWKLCPIFNKQILHHRRKVLLFHYTTYKRHLHCDSVCISSDRKNNDFVYHAYLRNVQNCQVKIFSTMIVKDRYNYSMDTIYYIFLNEIITYIILHIYSYRFQRAILINTLQSINVMNEFMIYKRIVCAVDIHRQAMELVSIQFISIRAHIVMYEIIIKVYFSFPWKSFLAIKI